MTSTMVQPGARGVDGVGLSTLRDFSKVVAAGYGWVSLYLGGTYGVKPYAIEAAWAAGLPVMLNYERVASAAKGGYRVGKAAAEDAIKLATDLGFHGEAPLPFSAADEHFADLAGAGLDYHRALVDVLSPIGWVGGAYGFKEMLALIAQQEWWPDDWPLWHWGGDGSTIYSWTWVKQGPGGSYYDATIGMNVDKNTLYKPMKFWSGYGADPPPPPPPTEEDVMTPEQEKKLDDVLTVLTAPNRFGPDTPSMEWAVAYTHAGQQSALQVLLQALAVLAQMVKDQPSSGGGASPEAIADELARRLARDA